MSWIVGWSSWTVAQDHLTGEEVGQPVVDAHARQIGQERAAGVAHDEIFECQVVEERARDGPDLDLADDDLVEHARDRPRQQGPSRRGERHRRHHAENHRHGADDEDEEEPGHEPAHQKA